MPQQMVSVVQLSINVADVLDAGFKSSRDMEDDLLAVKGALSSLVQVCILSSLVLSSL